MLSLKPNPELSSLAYDRVQLAPAVVAVPERDDYRLYDKFRMAGFGHLEATEAVSQKYNTFCAGHYYQNDQPRRCWKCKGCTNMKRLLLSLRTCVEIMYARVTYWVTLTTEYGIPDEVYFRRLRQWRNEITKAVGSTPAILCSHERTKQGQLHCHLIMCFPTVIDPRPLATLWRYNRHSSPWLTHIECLYGQGKDLDRDIKGTVSRFYPADRRIARHASIPTEFHDNSGYSSRQIAYYTTKYLTKDINTEGVFGKRRSWSTSSRFGHPEKLLIGLFRKLRPDLSPDHVRDFTEEIFRIGHPLTQGFFMGRAGAKEATAKFLPKAKLIMAAEFFNGFSEIEAGDDLNTVYSIRNGLLHSLNEYEFL